MDAQGAADGLAGSLRSVGTTLLDMIGTRAQLALVEMREEGERRKRMFFLALAGASFLAMALLFAGGFVVALFWDSHPLGAIAAVTAAYLAVALGALARLAVMVRESAPPFDETLRGLAADRELLRTGA